MYGHSANLESRGQVIPISSTADFVSSAAALVAVVLQNLDLNNLTGSSFTSRELNQGQVDFFKKLNTLGLSSSDFVVDLDCASTQRVNVHEVTVCINGEVSSRSSDVVDSSGGDDSDSTGPSLWGLLAAF
ncbi:unnamed protein product [Phytophthora lilii]|uniref:Unnamed protein product n=1 Tax=Phytophthora lilii TaxID=2077276 RepID=A0A9W6TB53_9STRA|nr:unnamed protein product [Phytophthora lilii]